MALLKDPAYFKCDRMSAVIKKTYCISLQDRLAEAVMSRSKDARHLLNAEIELSRCRNCPTGWRNRKEIQEMEEKGAYDLNRKNEPATMREAPKPKRCNSCGQVKPRSEFGRKASNPDGLEYQCKICKRAYQKKTRP